MIQANLTSAPELRLSGRDARPWPHTSALALQDPASHPRPPSLCRRTCRSPSPTVWQNLSAQSLHCLGKKASGRQTQQGLESIPWSAQSLTRDYLLKLSVTFAQPLCVDLRWIGIWMSVQILSSQTTWEAWFKASPDKNVCKTPISMEKKTGNSGVLCVPVIPGMAEGLK
jgi:hypothetical protein